MQTRTVLRPMLADIERCVGPALAAGPRCVRDAVRRQAATLHGLHRSGSGKGLPASRLPRRSFGTVFVRAADICRGAGFNFGIPSASLSHQSSCLLRSGAPPEAFGPRPLEAFVRPCASCWTKHNPIYIRLIKKIGFMYPLPHPARGITHGSPRSYRRAEGFTLVEVMMAACILTFVGLGLLTILIKAYDLVGLTRYHDAGRTTDVCQPV
jgi:hypothetical protein